MSTATATATTCAHDVEFDLLAFLAGDPGCAQCDLIAAEKLAIADAKIATELAEVAEIARLKELYKCPRCNGTGELAQYRYVNGGICFACNGHG